MLLLIEMNFEAQDDKILGMMSLTRSIKCGQLICIILIILNELVDEKTDTSSAQLEFLGKIMCSHL
jgi:hypothetical protein